MTVTLLVSDMSASGLHWKHHWLILAFALAIGENAPLTKLPGGNLWRKLKNWPPPDAAPHRRTFSITTAVHRYCHFTVAVVLPRANTRSLDRPYEDYSGSVRNYDSALP